MKRAKTSSSTAAAFRSEYSRIPSVPRNRLTRRVVRLLPLRVNGRRGPGSTRRLRRPGGSRLARRRCPSPWACAGADAPPLRSDSSGRSPRQRGTTRGRRSPSCPWGTDRPLPMAVEATATAASTLTAGAFAPWHLRRRFSAFVGVWRRETQSSCRAKRRASSRRATSSKGSAPRRSRKRLRLCVACKLLSTLSKITQYVE